jgi:hypothetical protein
LPAPGRSACPRWRRPCPRAEQELPEKIDPERDAELLRQFGLDPAALVEDFSGQSPEVG